MKTHIGVRDVNIIRRHRLREFRGANSRRACQIFRSFGIVPIWFAIVSFRIRARKTRYSFFVFTFTSRGRSPNCDLPQANDYDGGVITASLMIPVPVKQHLPQSSYPLNVEDCTDIPFIEDENRQTNSEYIIFLVSRSNVLLRWEYPPIGAHPLLYYAPAPIRKHLSILGGQPGRGLGQTGSYTTIKTPLFFLYILAIHPPPREVVRHYFGAACRHRLFNKNRKQLPRGRCAGTSHQSTPSLQCNIYVFHSTYITFSPIHSIAGHRLFESPWTRALRILGTIRRWQSDLAAVTPATRGAARTLQPPSYRRQTVDQVPLCTIETPSSECRSAERVARTVLFARTRKSLTIPFQVQITIVLSPRYRRTAVPCPVRRRRPTTSRRPTLVTGSRPRNLTKGARNRRPPGTRGKTTRTPPITTRRIKRWKIRTSSFIRKFSPALGWTVCRKAPAPPAFPNRRPSTKTSRNTDTTTWLYRRYVPTRSGKGNGGCM